MKFIYVLCNESRPLFIYEDFEKLKARRQVLVEGEILKNINATEASFPAFRLRIEDSI